MTTAEQADLIAHTLRNISMTRETFAKLPEHRKELERQRMQGAFYAVGRELLDVVMEGTAEDLLRIGAVYRAAPVQATG